jgi:uridine phosphorylase
MFKTSLYKPHHINATVDDIAGNKGIGRYIFLPGSEGRAEEIASHFGNVVEKPHPRGGHTLYLGTLQCDGKQIDVASIASGMGCPSTEIFLHELFNLGAKRFLRVGTAGTLQPSIVNVGTIVNVQASVRDEGTTIHYAPLEIPAIASIEFVTSVLVAAEKLNLTESIHTGIVHCKSSLYARELSAGPRAPENQHYLNLLSQSGVLATEMETASLFIQSQLYNYQLMQEGDLPQHRVLAGAILAIISTTDHLASSSIATDAIQDSIELALETIKILATQELDD